MAGGCCQVSATAYDMHMYMCMYMCMCMCMYMYMCMHMCMHMLHAHAHAHAGRMSTPKNRESHTTGAQGRS